MSTYTAALTELSEKLIPGYVTSAMSVTSQTGNEELTLMKALQDFATAHNMNISDFFNMAGLSPEQLGKAEKAQKGDSSYGGPPIEVPCALLVSAGGVVSDAIGSKTISERGRRVSAVMSELQKGKNFKDVGVDGIYISEIIAQIPPDVMAKIFKGVNPNGDYFAIGILEDRNHPLKKEELPAGQFDLNKPVYRKSVSIACHNDHNRPSTNIALGTWNTFVKESTRKVWQKQFIELSNTAGAKAAQIEAFFKSSSEGNNSKIRVLSIEKASAKGVPILDKTSACDFTMHLEFDCTYSVKEEFLEEFREQIEKGMTEVDVTEKAPSTTSTPVKAPVVKKAPVQVVRNY